MQEKDLIFNLKGLKQIKPRKEWAVLAKQRIFEADYKKTAKAGAPLLGRLSAILDVFPRFLSSPAYKYALATFMFVVLIASSVVLYAQNALPGDTLFSLKKVSEKTRMFLAAKSKVSGYQLENANTRLTELTQIAETKQDKKLAPAIKEFQASAREAALNINNSIKKGDVLDKNVVAQAEKLVEAKDKVKAMGISLGDTDDIDNALSNIVQAGIKDLEASTLTDDQKIELDNAKKDYENKDYSSALEKILMLTQQ